MMDGRSIVEERKNRRERNDGGRDVKEEDGWPVKYGGMFGWRDGERERWMTDG